MQWFKFDWFRSEERKELDRLKVEEQVLKNTLLEKRLGDSIETPYKKLIYSNGNLTVVMPFGVVINQKDVDSLTYKYVKEAKDEEEIRMLLTGLTHPASTKVDYSKEDIQFVETGVNKLRNNPDFDFRGGRVYLKGVNLELPPEVLASFIEIHEKLAASLAIPEQNYEALAGHNFMINQLEAQYESLKMFWLKLATSPSKESREQVLTFCRNNDIRISRRGNIIAYRRVVTFKQKAVVDQRLLQFVNERYDQIKSWKKSPSSYFVFAEDDGELILSKSDKTDGISKLHGNLAELKISLTEVKPVAEAIYTSAHNSGKYTFKIGDVYKADEGDIDTNAGNCAAGGLHFAAVNYNYSGFGDTPIVVLVNPAKTITIPTYEYSKGRTTEMKIVCINPNPHGVHIDESLIDQADADYNEFTIDQLEEALRTKDFSELCAEDEVPVINLIDLANITNALRNRVVTI